MKEQIELRQRLGQSIAELRKLEAELGPHYEELARTLDHAAPRGSSLQPQLLLFQKLDGAIAAYEGLLGSLEEQPS